MDILNNKTSFRFTCLALAVISTLGNGDAMAAGPAVGGDYYVAAPFIGATNATQLNAGQGGVVDVTGGGVLLQARGSIFLHL